MAATVFADRTEAGILLGAAVRDRLGELPETLVMGIPRGGVVTAAAVASALGAALDVAISRKVGAPGNPELAIGAVGPDGREILDEAVLDRLQVEASWVAGAVARARAEVQARQVWFRGDRPPLRVSGRRVVVVDDGLATGSTAAAVGRWLRMSSADHSVLAVPVGPGATVDRLSREYDELVVLAEPEPFFAVGQFYGDFRQVTDDEVKALLAS